MKKSYLLIFNAAAGDSSKVSKLLDQIPEIITWRYDLPYAIYVISEASATALSEKFKPLVDSKARYAFFEVNENRQGWLTGDSWYLLRHKEHKTADTKQGTSS
jgi:hypothetical protein